MNKSEKIQQTGSKKWIQILERLLIICLYLLLTAASAVLYYRQTIQYEGPLGAYDSDLPAHISEGVNHTAYSLMERTFGFLRTLFSDTAVSNLAIAFWIALLTAAGAYLMFCLIHDRNKNGSVLIQHLISIASIFVTAIYIPSVNPCPYLGTQTGSIWHNSTYIGMRAAGMLVILLYDRYQETYRKGIQPSQWILFTLSLVLVNLMKPNFILAFAPAMALLLLADCIADHGKTIGKQIVFGIPVLISLIVVFYEMTVLFQGENSESSIVIGLPYGLIRWNYHPVTALLQSAAFPLAVLVISFRDLARDRKYRASWLIWLVGLVEYLTLTEDGPRATHGNLSWGYSFCMFLIFGVCAGWMFREFSGYGRSILAAVRDSGQNTIREYCRESIHLFLAVTWKERIRILWMLFAALLLLYHLKCGLQFARMIWLGGSYLAGIF